MLRLHSPASAATSPRLIDTFSFIALILLLPAAAVFLYPIDHYFRY